MKKTFVAVSGGRTSGFMAYVLKDEPNHCFFFQNTGRERPETYDFLNEMDLRFNLNLVWLEYYCPDPFKKATFRIVDYDTASRNGTPFSQLNAKRKAIPNKFKRFCTAELKVKTARRYIRSRGLLRWNYAIGYRADEPKRKVRSDSMQTAITPLRDAGITAADIADFWKGMDFDLQLPLLPNGKTFGGNCIGCFWHSEYQNAHLCKTRPKDVEWLIKEEKKHGYTFNDAYSFEDLAEWVKENPDLDGLANKDMICQETNGVCGV